MGGPRQREHSKIHVPGGDDWRPVPVALHSLEATAPRRNHVSLACVTARWYQAWPHQSAPSRELSLPLHSRETRFRNFGVLRNGATAGTDSAGDLTADNDRHATSQ